MRVSPHQRLLRVQLTMILGLMGCDATTTSTLAGCLPFAIPGLTTDAGPPQVVPLTGGPYDASGFFVDADGGLAGVEAACGVSTPCDPALGLDCVPVTSDRSVCLQRCGGGEACPDGRACDALGPGRYCLAQVSRGSPCEVGTCDADAGLRCLVARTEGGRAVAFTCQQPCSPDAPGCAPGEACLPGAAAETESAGVCPCTGTFQCTGPDAGNRCVREQSVCGRQAPLGDPGQLGRPSLWNADNMCDPGAAQRYCGGNLAGGAPVFCAQGGSPSVVVDGGFSPVGVTGICVAVCVDPPAGAQYPCPSGFTCNTTLQDLVDVAPDAGTCVTNADCTGTPGAICAGPLSAYGGARRCARPYGLCAPQ